MPSGEDMASEDASGSREMAARGDPLDQFLSVYTRRPHACFSGCLLALATLTALSVATGSMSMTSDEFEAWQVHDAKFTRAWSAIQQAREASQQARAEAPQGGGRRLPALRNDGAEEGALHSAAAAEGAAMWMQGASSLAAASTAGTWVEEPVGEGVERRLGSKGKRNTLQLYYKAPDGSTVFTPERLQEMCRFERILLRSSVCDNNCLRNNAGSPVLLFYGGADEGSWRSCPLLPQSAVDATVALITQSVDEDGADSLFAPLLHPDFAATGSCPLTRSEYKVLKKADDGTTSKEVVFEDMFMQFDQPLQYGFLRSAFQADEDRFAQLGGLRVRVYLQVNEVGKMLATDFYMTACACLFVLLAMWLHLGSLFIASCAMFQIAVSLPISALIYRQVFQVDYFEFLHVLVVYLVLGIGADDVFVLMDSWRHITQDPRHAGNIHQALRATWMRTCNAVFNTSFTTAVAFMSMSISKVMPMRTCGWYAALCIFVNYISVITFTPAAMVIYQQRFAGKPCFCPDSSVKEDWEAPMRSCDSDPQTWAKGNLKFASVVEYSIKRFYLPAFTYRLGPIRPVPLASVLVMLSVGVQGAYFSFQLTPPKNVEEWFPSDHMWTNLTEFAIHNSFQPKHGLFDEQAFVFGIKDMNFDDFETYRPSEHPGEPEYDPDFDLTTSEAQQAILDVCQRLRELPCHLEGCKTAGTGKFAMRQGQLVGVSCFLEDMQRWYDEEQNATDVPLPTGQDFLTELYRFRSEANAGELGAGTRGRLVRVNYVQDIGFIGGRLRFVSIRVRSTLPGQEPFGTGSSVRDLIDEWVEGVRGTLPRPLQSFTVGSDNFADYDLGSELISGLFTGCAIAGPMSFLVILLSTRNVLLALYAVLSVAFIVLSVLGFCKSAMGWDLGIAEAVAGVIVIGYSIDYVLHLAHVYCEADRYGAKTRTERATFAMEHIGSTVFAGAVTTAGSSVFMFACFMTFFTKMALLICVTISYSFLFSLFFFMGLCFIAGPSDACGRLTCLDGVTERLWARAAKAARSEARVGAV